ncbi:MAG: amidase [Acidobacteria bacterium]|nr:amidase [Acidobacteriota bacterium]
MNDDATKPGDHPSTATAPRRREMLKALAAAGAVSAVFGRALVALADEKAAVTDEMIRQAEWVSGIALDDAQRKLMLDDVNETLQGYAKSRAVAIDNGVAPALMFDPAPFTAPGVDRGRVTSPGRPAPRVGGDDDMAFASVADLGALLRARKISSVDLTKLYLKRLDRYDPILKVSITRTTDLALEQAAKADREMAGGHDRGALHGIPWGVKDLFAVPGFPTTWGAEPYRDQVRKERATVVSRIDEAGGVLLAKTAVGALAWGDVWFGGMTRNPWKTEQGSSGSSAGSASGTAAGLFGFAIGTETLGSVVSPSTRCGTTGLRPTFGRVSRFGAMALSWSMDKVGVLARSAEDCALVFGAIHGADPLDASAVTQPFSWPSPRAPRSLRVGYVKSLFDEDRGAEIKDEAQKARAREWQEIDDRALEALRTLGIELVPIALPKSYPLDGLGVILRAEAATAFDELTRTGRVAELKRQTADAWPNVFRQAQLIPAVEYLRANRIRRLVMTEMEQIMSGIDLYVSPTYSGSNLLLTNLTGHPQVVFPDGFRASDGTPVSLTLTGRLFGEAEILSVARSFQQATDHHLRRPDIKPPVEPAT